MTIISHGIIYLPTFPKLNDSILKFPSIYPPQKSTKPSCDWLALKYKNYSNRRVFTSNYTAQALYHIPPHCLAYIPNPICPCRLFLFLSGLGLCVQPCTLIMLISVNIKFQCNPMLSVTSYSTLARDLRVYVGLSLSPDDSLLSSQPRIVNEKPFSCTIAYIRFTFN